MKVSPLLFLFACLVAQGQDSAAKLFTSRCAACHGVDGDGGEHGPSIADPRRSSSNLRDTIATGIPERGMPAFNLSEVELDGLISYIGILRAPASDHPPEGDPQAGQNFFSGAGGCTRCHMINGRGGALGPDLTNVGRERRLPQIEQALRRPESLHTPGYRSVTIHTIDGKTFSGVAKNESNYDLQIQGVDGVLRVFSKSQITTETTDRGSLMPKVTATEPEIRDLLAFLSRLKNQTAPAIDSTTASANGISFKEILTPKPGDWPTYHGRLNGNRHSELKQIDVSNVAHLAPAWMFPVARAQRLEGTPVVVDGIMYVTTANECFAVDAKYGRQIWHYQRPLTKGVIGDAASAINRGVAILRDKVFMVTDDAHIIAISRVNGHLLWDTEMADYRQHYGATGAPLVVGNLVLSGTSGGDEGARGFIDAYNVDTGARVWRFWTVPAKGEPGSETWIGRAIEHGCVDAWLTGTFDPAANLIYWPTGNPCPDYNGDQRQGDNLYADSVVALEPATGKLRWHYQFTPHDLHDWDAVAPLLAVDARFQGKPRQLLLQANRNGFFYVLDRITGEFLLGEPFVKKMDWADGIAPKGRPKVRASATPTPSGTKACPAVVGATNWFSSAYNPVTGLFYVMALESCGIYTKSDAWWEQGKSFYGGGTRHVPGETPERFLRALDIQTGKIVWEIPQVGSEGGWGGVLSTAGGLVFFCDEAGALAAADAKTGKLLWHFYTNQPWHASPMTYSIDDKQYIAVASGSNFIAFALP